MNKSLKIAALCVTGALAACQTVDYGGPVAVAPPAGAAEGQWVGTDGIAVSSFNNGVFASNATDTGTKLAEGSYRYTDPRTVAITFTSLMRKTTVQANCAVVTDTQMNCTSSSGAQFSLIRKASAPV
jgi:pyridoxal biosynthesis lyase PdxS